MRNTSFFVNESHAKVGVKQKSISLQRVHTLTGSTRRRIVEGCFRKLSFFDNKIIDKR